jgi:hypothetical protein
MVYGTQNCWVFGLCPLTGILEARKHNVSETGFVSVLSDGETPTPLGPLQSDNLNHWTTPVRFTTCLHKFSIFFFALVLMHLVLLARFVAQISTFLSILVPRMCVLYHNFYCIFSCYLPPN